MIDADQIEAYNGVRKFTYGRAEQRDQVGVVSGLAWDASGRELLNIEALAVSGKGRQIKTGSLGDVMQESIQAALTFVRSRAEVLGIPADFPRTPRPAYSRPRWRHAERRSVGWHRHVYRARQRADRRPVGRGRSHDREITLRGQVLPIGGLKEKLLAAQRGGHQARGDPQRE